MNTKIVSIIVSGEKEVIGFSLLILKKAEEFCPLEPLRFTSCSKGWETVCGKKEFSHKTSYNRTERLKV